MGHDPEFATSPAVQRKPMLNQESKQLLIICGSIASPIITIALSLAWYHVEAERAAAETAQAAIKAGLVQRHIHGNGYRQMSWVKPDAEVEICRSREHEH